MADRPSHPQAAMMTASEVWGLATRERKLLAYCTCTSYAWRERSLFLKHCQRKQKSIIGERYNKHMERPSNEGEKNRRLIAVIN